MTDYIHRALEAVVRRASEYFKIVVVTGPRQVGKTTMLRHMMQDDAQCGDARSYVTLDDMAARILAKEDPALFLQRYKPPILIDEIQKAPELLPYLKILADETKENGTIWLTGSQPFHLMKHVSESLAGRARVIEMLGLSHAEASGIESKPYNPSPDYFMRRVAAAHRRDVTEVFDDIAAGSLPGIRALPEDQRGAAYDSYIDTYIMRDVRDLAQVGDELKFRRFMMACAALTSRPVVYAELARLADVNEKTAKTWLSLLVSSYLVKVVPPYANNLLKRLSKQPIMHFLDVGLAAHLAGWSNARVLETGAMSGQAFESHAFGELYKSYSNAGEQPPFHFFRTNDKKEIDLLMEQDGVLYPIEVKKTASPGRGDLKNMSSIDGVADAGAPPELESFKREIGTGAVVCMTQDAYPLDERTWAFPVWAI